MLFSIIVPVYKVEQYIDKCVDSLRAQTYSEIEIILVDDGSPDNCPQICNHYAQLDKRIRVVHQPNGGLSDARNTGLSVAKGKYVLFVDSDDYIAPDTCERFACFADSDVEVIVGSAKVVGGRNDLVTISSSDVLTGECFLKKSLLEKKLSMAAVLYVYKTAFLNDNNLRFQKGILHEDEEFTPRALLAAQSVVATGYSFYSYVIRDNSITTQKDYRKNATDFYNTCLKLEKVYSALDDRRLRRMLLDSLVIKYLNIFQVGALHRYNTEYIHKRFVFLNAKRLKTKLKAILFCMNCKLYYKLNKTIKSGKRT